MAKPQKLKKVSKKKTNKKAKLIMNTCGGNYGQVFWNPQTKQVHYVHYNDGDWRDEYFNPLLDMFDISLEYVDKDDLPKYVRDELEACCDNEGYEEDE